MTPLRPRSRFPAGEEPELDQLGLARVLGFELPEGVLQGERAFAGVCPVLADPFVPGPVAEDAPHGFCHGREDVPRPFHFGASAGPAKRRYASWTREVAWRVWPGSSLVSRAAARWHSAS